jgi:hypothetical protein
LFRHALSLPHAHSLARSLQQHDAATSSQPKSIHNASHHRLNLARLQTTQAAPHSVTHTTPNPGKRHETWRKTKSPVSTLSVAIVPTAMSANSAMIAHLLRKRRNCATDSPRGDATVGPAASTHTTYLPPDRTPAEPLLPPLILILDVGHLLVLRLTTSLCNGATTSKGPDKTSSEHSRSVGGSQTSSNRRSYLWMPQRLCKKSSPHFQMKVALNV